MLHNRDYILRIIEQLGRALNRILNQLLSRSVDEIEDLEAELSGIAFQAGLDLDLARQLSVDSLPMLVAPTGTVDPSRCWLLAELLFLHGFHAEKSGDASSARQSYLRALHLYRMVRPEWSSEIALPEARARIDELERRLTEIGPAGGE